MVFKIHEPSEVVVARRVHDALTGEGDIVVPDLLGVLGIAGVPNAEGALRMLAQYLPVPQRSEPPPPEPEYVWSDHEGGHEFTKPRCLRLGGWQCHAKTWRQAVRCASDILYYEHREVFREMVCVIRGDRRSYFSDYAGDLSDPWGIADSGLYVETSISANNAASLIRVLARRFGYTTPGFD